MKMNQPVREESTSSGNNGSYQFSLGNVVACLSNEVREGVADTNSGSQQQVSTVTNKPEPFQNEQRLQEATVDEENQHFTVDFSFLDENDASLKGVEETETCNEPSKEQDPFISSCSTSNGNTRLVEPLYFKSAEISAHDQETPVLSEQTSTVLEHTSESPHDIGSHRLLDSSLQSFVCSASEANLISSDPASPEPAEGSLLRTEVSASDCQCHRCVLLQNAQNATSRNFLLSIENNVEPCPNCDELKTVKQMIRHINIVHRGMMYKCAECQALYKCLTELKLHYTATHNEVQVPIDSDVEVVYTLKPKFKSKEEFLSWNARFRTNNRTSKSEWCTLCNVTMRRNTRTHFELNHGIDKHQCLTCHSWHHTKKLAFRHCSNNRFVAPSNPKRAKSATETPNSSYSKPSRRLHNVDKVHDA